MKVVYIGLKPQKGDNVAGTQLVWAPGQVHEIADEKIAAKLVEHADIWADAAKPYKLLEQGDPSRAPLPSVTITVPGAKFIVEEPPEVLSGIAQGALIAVFMTKEDRALFEEWKLDRATAPDSTAAAGAVLKKNPRSQSAPQASVSPMM